ncbi:MAG: hypothetical protein AB7G28_06805 [Pirellulales bacterium]
MSNLVRLCLFTAVLAFAWNISGAVLAQAFGQAPTQAPRPEGPTLYEPQVDIRNGGVLDESYGYHRQAQANQSARPGPYPPAGGWYGYGFPVSTYRWGWFGAERYYPRVGWRNNYNNDCIRWAYRYGY